MSASKLFGARSPSLLGAESVFAGGDATVGGVTGTPGTVDVPAVSGFMPPAEVEDCTSGIGGLAEASTF